MSRPPLENPEVRQYEIEKRFNAMELSHQRQLQQRDREISELQLRVTDLEDALASVRGMLVFMGAV